VFIFLYTWKDIEVEWVSWLCTGICNNMYKSSYMNIGSNTPVDSVAYAQGNLVVGKLKPLQNMTNI